MRITCFTIWIIVAILVPVTISAAHEKNDTVFFSRKWKPCGRDTAAFFRPPEVKEDDHYRRLDYFRSGQLQMDGLLRSLEPEIRDGKFTYYDSLGRITGKEQFRSGVRIDTFRYYEANRLVSERIHLDDTSWIYLKFYSQNTGRLTREGGTKNHLESGLWRYYSSAGKLRRTGYYDSGLNHGCMISFDTVTGQVTVESDYFHDELIFRSYYMSGGMLYLDFHYKDGMFHGIAHEYDTLTGNIRAVREYRRGEAQGPIKIYCPDCEFVQVEGKLSGGVIDGEWKYYFNCSDKIASIVSWSYGSKDGMIRFFDKSSQNIIGEGMFWQNKAEGAWKYYYPDKKHSLRTLKNYNNNELDGKLVSWWPNGQLRREETYSAGVLNSWKCYALDSQKDTIYYPYSTPPVFLKDPQYYIDHNLIYPEVLKAHPVVGKVKVVITVTSDGHILDVDVLDINERLFEAETIRVCKQIPVVAAGEEEGMPAFTRVTYTLTINPPE